MDGFSSFMTFDFVVFNKKIVDNISPLFRLYNFSTPNFAVLCNFSLYRLKRFLDGSELLSSLNVYKICCFFAVSPLYVLNISSIMYDELFISFLESQLWVERNGFLFPSDENLLNGICFCSDWFSSIKQSYIDIDLRRKNYSLEERAKIIYSFNVLSIYCNPLYCNSKFSFSGRFINPIYRTLDALLQK